MNKQTGIILRAYKNKKKIALLDPILGRIDAIYNQSSLLSTGTKIAYSVSKSTHYFYITDIEIINMPLFLAQEDLLFIHHILELIFYLIPIGCIEPTIFKMCEPLYSQKNITSKEKKIIICALFIVSGFGPSIEYQEIRINRINPIDMIHKESLHLADEQTLDAWLRACMHQHPSISNFKTKQFLNIHNIV